MSKHEPLLPCPFCGGDAEIRQYGSSYEQTIYGCFDCGCELETGEDRNYGHRWNQRALERELLQELQNIANADTSNWLDPSDFEVWAKSRARHVIAKATGGEA